MPGLTPNINRALDSEDSGPAPLPFINRLPTLDGRSERIQLFVDTPPTLPGLFRPFTFGYELPHERYLRADEVRAAFPSDYFASRQRFLEQAESLGAQITSRPLAAPARGPGGETLTIDIAHLGSKFPKQVLLHLAGVHGVEGFVGSAIQSEIMRARPVVAEGSALVLVHCLNPYGMAHLRRVNADNVDLNRNFIPPGEKWGRGTPDGYELLHSLLNPERIDFPLAFYPLLGLKALKHGTDFLRSEILRGQYGHPNGLFFGGSQPEEETSILREYISEHLSRAERVVSIDVHSGLGTPGGQTVYVELLRQDPRFQLLEDLLPQPLVPLPDDYYTTDKPTRGALCDEIPKLFPNARVDSILQEFGTYSPYKVLAALREENYYSRILYSGARLKAAQKLKDIFVPKNLAWLTSTLQRGTELAVKAALALQD